MIKVGCLGPDGTFSQLALRRYIENTPHTEVQYSSIPELMIAASNDEVDLAVVPIENSLEGGVNTTLDALAHHENLTIICEMLFIVHQNLLSNSPLNEITHIYSHPQPVGQCGKYIASSLAGVPVEFTASTALAAQRAASEKGAAALGSDTLAEIYGLKIVAPAIEDNSANTTRFIVIGKQAAIPTDCDKTSIVFGVEDKPGSLFKILSIFDIFGINMMKIESRPAKTFLGEYLFFVDIEGNMENEDIKKALELVEYKASYYKNLGSYKKAEL